MCRWCFAATLCSKGNFIGNTILLEWYLAPYFSEAHEVAVKML